jgi:hypothetical protein
MFSGHASLGPTVQMNIQIPAVLLFSAAQPAPEGHCMSSRNTSQRCVQAPPKHCQPESQSEVFEQRWYRPEFLQDEHQGLETSHSSVPSTSPFPHCMGGSSQVPFSEQIFSPPQDVPGSTGSYSQSYSQRDVLMTRMSSVHMLLSLQFFVGGCIRLRGHSYSQREVLMTGVSSVHGSSSAQRAAGGCIRLCGHVNSQRVLLISGVSSVHGSRSSQDPVRSIGAE